MKGFLWNVLLAVVWTMITGNFAPVNLIFGFALGFVVLLLAGPVIGSTDYIPRIRAVASLISFFLFELLKSNLRMAYDVVRPQLRTQPGIIAIPIDAITDLEITLLANLITLTPGSLSLDVSAGGETLYLHAMDIGDSGALRKKIKDGFERRILAVTR
jgi:multicomponent Na+:H+ antiporter subunit E